MKLSMLHRISFIPDCKIVNETFHPRILKPNYYIIRSIYERYCLSSHSSSTTEWVQNYTIII